MSENKLHIEVAGNVLDIEGDADLVKEVYEDFKQQVADSSGPAAPQPAPNQAPELIIPAAPIDPVTLRAADQQPEADVAPIIKIAANLEAADAGIL